MPKYQLSDDQAIEIIEADDMEHAKELARESWQAGSWDGKCVIDVRIAELDEDDDETGYIESIDVECGEDPPEPECTSDDGHDWQSPYEVVGGLRENPGVWSKGGTTFVYKQCCAHCGRYRTEVAYGAQRNPGQCDSVEYDDADEVSSAWVEDEAKRND